MPRGRGRSPTKGAKSPAAPVILEQVTEAQFIAKYASLGAFDVQCQVPPTADTSSPLYAFRSTVLRIRCESGVNTLVGTLRAALSAKLKGALPPNKIKLHHTSFGSSTFLTQDSATLAQYNTGPETVCILSVKERGGKRAK